MLTGEPLSLSHTRRNGLRRVSLWQADTVVMSTGFETQDFLSGVDVTGVSGARLNDLWAGGEALAYMGVSVPQLPNVSGVAMWCCDP